MVNRITSWRSRLQATAVAATHTLETEKVPEGKRLFLETVSVRNQTTAVSYFQVVINTAGYDHVVDNLTTSVVTKYETVKPEIWVAERESIKIKLTSGGGADVLEAYLTGILRDISD